MKIEYFSRKTKRNGLQWFFRIKAGNNKVIAQSEGYANERNCLKTCELIAGDRMKVARVEV